ncbi:hypothetical protein ACP275_10G162600 [Erythranthe tilingii]
MMAIPMENNKENSSKELAQRLFSKNVELENKRRKAAQARIPSDPSTWQQMRENYEAIVLEDHAFSEQHEIEYALWQLHYRRIEELRALFNASLASAKSAAAQNGKGPVRSGPDRVAKIRSQLKTFLSESTGFYHDLMLKIKAKYGLPLGYSSDDADNQITMSKDGSKLSEVKKCLISCHRCLIYLGDLARYKGLYGEGESKALDFAAASSYYMQASSFCSSNGNPHHQLAILAGYSSDELVSIYRYFRSLAIDNPFVTARDNLVLAFEKNREKYTELVGDGRSTVVKTIPQKAPGRGRGKGGARTPSKDVGLENAAVKERTSDHSERFKAFITRFVRLNGILFTRTSLETLADVFSTVKNDLLGLLSSGQDEDLNFGSDTSECRLAIIRMIAILIFTVHDANENGNQSYAEIVQRSVVLQNALTSTFEFMGCILERCNQLKDPSSSYLLPGIMVFVEWLACRPDVAVSSELEEKQQNARSFFWNKCILLLNNLLSNRYIFVNEHEEEAFSSNTSKYDESETANRLALSEDFELRGFLPLLPAQLILDFSRKHSFGGDGIGGNKEKTARMRRIIAAGKALANGVRLGQEGVYFDSKLNKFVIGIEPQISDDYLLTSPLEPNSNGSSVGISVGGGHAIKQEVGVGADEEDEDEVIVFRPSMNERHVDEFSSNLTSAEVLPTVRVSGKIDNVKENVSSVGNDSFLFQSKVNARPSASVASATSQYLLPVQPNMSKWPVEQAPNLNGLAHLNLMENGSSLKSELQDQFEVSQPAALSLPYPKFVNTFSGHNNFSNHISEASVSSKFDSIMSSRASTDGLHVNPSSIMPPGFKKNPVSRPVRYLGPPPGFGSVPLKGVDESSKMAFPPVPQMDNYSWLDGYQLSSLNQSVGFRDSINQVGPTFYDVNSSNGSMGIANFPFPGKQISSLQVQGENQRGSQQPVGLPLQYHVQSPGDARFFV